MGLCVFEDSHRMTMTTILMKWCCKHVEQEGWDVRSSAPHTNQLTDLQSLIVAVTLYYVLELFQSPSVSSCPFSNLVSVHLVGLIVLFFSNHFFSSLLFISRLFCMSCFSSLLVSYFLVFLSYLCPFVFSHFIVCLLISSSLWLHLVSTQRVSFLFPNNLFSFLFFYFHLFLFILLVFSILVSCLLL